MDAFAVLQLAPSAPRPLLDEVYWMLIASANDAVFTAETHARINAINEAYREIIASDAAPAAVAPLPRRVRRRLFGRPQVSLERATHYQALRLSPVAGPAVVDVAHRVLGSAYSPHSLDRARVDDAFRVLSDPELRAKYDKALGIKHEDEASPAAVATNGSVAPDSQKVEHEPSAQRNEIVAAGPRVAPEPLLSTVETAAIAAPAEPSRPRRIIPFGRRPRPRREAVAPVPDVIDDPAAVIAAEPSASLAETASDRVVALGVEHPPAPASPSAARAVLTAGLPNGDAHVRFAAGPLRGRQFELGDLLEIPASDELEEHLARITRYGDRFVFRSRPDVSAAINNEPLSLPLAFLDDGDEIEVGDHTLRFVVKTASHSFQSS